MESVPVPAYRGVEVFALQDFPRALELDDEGLHHPRSPRSRARTLTRYQDFTHLATSPRTLWLGTLRSAYVLPRRAFVDPNGPENLVRALLTRIAQSPHGTAQLARMTQIEELARTRGPLTATWGLTALCLLIFALQLIVGPVVHEVGYYSSILVFDGDLWRAVTANLLHAFPTFPLHLGLNLLALLALGFVVERPLGSWRTVCVMGISAIGSMWVSGLVESRPVVGASGVIFGLVGAALWLELRCSDQLPAWWRLPRRVFAVLILVSIVLPIALPIIAWAAHLGGLVAGFAATALLARRSLPEPILPPRRIRLAAAGVVGLTALAVLAAGRELATSDDFLADHAARLAVLPGISPYELNDRAWLIAIEPEHTEAQVEAALRLAERAVSETDRSQPEILDTLAEVQFQLGRSEEAIATIDEAIEQVPDESYYREQRRRFLGERAADDRPTAPLPWSQPESSPVPEEEGLSV